MASPLVNMAHSCRAAMSYREGLHAELSRVRKATGWGDAQLTWPEGMASSSSASSM